MKTNHIFMNRWLHLLLFLSLQIYSSISSAIITVTYGDSFPDDYKIPFNYAVDIWNHFIDTSGDNVEIYATYLDLGSPTTAGYGKGNGIRNFANAPENAPTPYYNMALANQFAGSDLNGTTPINDDTADIIVKINSVLGVTAYLGTDGHTPAGQLDLVTTIIHEIAHGLGFGTLFSYDSTTGEGKWLGTTPNIYETFISTSSGKLITDNLSFPTPSVDLGNILTSDDLYFTGLNAIAANGGIAPKIYAPSSYIEGSSIQHLDETSYGNNSLSLMTPSRATGVAIHNPGPLTLAIFKDLGWQLNTSSPLIINEIDYDNVGTDNAEFIEIKNNSNIVINLSNYNIDLFNNTTGTIYRNITLPDVNLAANDYYVICGDNATVANCDLDVLPNTNLIQNGPLDVVALKKSSFIIDTVTYEGNVIPSIYTETAGTTAADSHTNPFVSLSRFPDGTDTNNNNADFALKCITPGAANNVNASSDCYTLTIDDPIAVTEGNSDTTTINFTITLSHPAVSNVTVNYTTADDTATAGTDYTAASGTLTLTPGQTSQTVTITIVGDQINENSSETFKVNLTSSSNNAQLSTIVGATEGIGTIIDNDIATDDDVTDSDDLIKDVTDNTSNQTTTSYKNSNPLPKTMNVTIILSGSGSGKIITEPVGINCQKAEDSCKATFSTGSKVTLIAIPDENSEFSGFGGHIDCSDGQLFLVGNRQCTIFFKKKEISASDSNSNGTIHHLIPTYRLWSYHWQNHFYTIDENEKNWILSHPQEWRDEGIAYYVYDKSDHPAYTQPVYRFWSYVWESHFYTMDQQEMERLVTDFPDQWRYEGVAYYAYAEDTQLASAIPIYRFYSFDFKSHFYTSSDNEQQALILRPDTEWRYEGIAWYVAVQ